MVAINSTFVGNQAVSAGGGVSVNIDILQGTDSETLYGDLFYNNQAGTVNSVGGGLALIQITQDQGLANFKLFNSTFYDNFSDSYGGGIYLYFNAVNRLQNNVALTSLTVYENQASTAGGGLDVDPASVEGQGEAPNLNNNIIAGNTVQNSPDMGPDIYGKVYSLGFNLIGITDGSNPVGGWIASDIVGTSAAPQDPGLTGGLQNNGGPTLTIQLPKTSAAYQNGDTDLPKNSDGTQLDQRGYIRPAKPSIGAYDPDAVQPGSGSGSGSIHPSGSGHSAPIKAGNTQGAGLYTMAPSLAIIGSALSHNRNVN